MPEQKPPTDATKPGAQTSEFKLTLGTIIGTAAAIIAGATVTVQQLQDVFPGAAALVAIAGILGTSGMVVGALAKFIGSRTAVKTEMIAADAQVEAAKVQASAAREALIATASTTTDARRP